LKERSKYRGVTWKKKSSQWVAKIHFAGKTEHLGYFDDEAEAGRAYDKRARQLGRERRRDRLLGLVERRFGSGNYEPDQGSECVCPASRCREYYSAALQAAEAAVHTAAQATWAKELKKCKVLLCPALSLRCSVE
jgi:hypothetical protein